MTIASPISLSNDVRYDWQRFWIAQTGSLDLSDAGFLRDPEEYPFGRSDLKKLDEIDVYPVLALLGEPGIGKSAALKFEHERVSQLGAEENTVSDYVDLKVSSSEDRLYRRIFESPQVEAWKASDGRLYLFLDSLDEAMLQIDTVAHLLVEGLRNLPTKRMSIRIACRTAVWPFKTLGDPLKEIWGEAGLGIFELAPLRRCDVLTALSANGIDPEEFMPKLFGAHAVPFAIKPLTLKMLLTLYKRNGGLPSSTVDLYCRGCLALCEERSDSRREKPDRRGHLSAHQRLRLAARIAAATVLGHRVAVWTGPEAETPTEDVAISALAGAREDGDFPTFIATEGDVREVLDTGLFCSRGDQRMGWAHNSYGEFLSALYLYEKNVPPSTSIKVLTHPTSGLIPQIAMVGAWFASFIPESRSSLIATDPWTLLYGDLSNWSDTDRELLVRSLLEYKEEGRFHEYPFGFMELFEKLRYSGLADQIRAIIVRGSLKAHTRRLAISIAEACELMEMQPVLLRSALDQTEDPIVRAAAISALRHCSDASVPYRILELLQGGIGYDPDTEIRGCALDLLWPNHITAAELFPLLTQSNEHYVGSYARFLFDLPDSLRTQDLVPAIAWATAYIAGANDTSEFREKTLADAIMFKAWEVFEDPDLTDVFLTHIVTKLNQHVGLCCGTNIRANEAFQKRLSTDVSRRRHFLTCLFRRQVNRLDAFSCLQVGLIKNDDFDWLLEISPAGALSIPGLNAESLSNFIRLLFNIENDAQFEALYSACKQWPLLRSHFAFLLDGVLIDSQAAEQGRETLKLERQMQEYRERFSPPAVADLPSEIPSLVARAENGEWQAWWQLNLALMFTPQSSGVGDELNYFITSMPGWLTADETLRQRIITTSERYLSEAESSADIWLGQRQMNLQRSDLAAMRAFILLLQLATDNYQRIPIAAWKKWTPVIIGLPWQGVITDCLERKVLLQDALIKAPQEFIATVLKILHLEKERNRISTEYQGSNASSPFLFLRTIDGCWNDERLKSAMFEEMCKSDITTTEYAALLDALVKASYDLAIEHALVRIEALEEETLEIAVILMRHIPVRVWPLLWGKMVSSDERARAVLMRYATSYSIYSRPFYAEIDDEAIAALYLLMERLFPPENDPEGPSGFVSPLDSIPVLRDSIPRYLAAKGTEGAVRALRRLVVERPNIPLLPFELSRAELSFRMKTWSPLTPKEIFALTDQPNSRLITSAGDLLHILEDTLAKFATELHGAQTPVRDLWDRQSGGDIYRPIDENGLSDVIVRYLRRELEGKGIFANREVEVTRRPSAPVGQRTDILINTLRRTINGQAFDPIAAVIEVKGGWNSTLFTAMESQLVQDYMVRFSAPVGIYLVGWFDTAHWDGDDYRRRSQERYGTIADVRDRLNQQAMVRSDGFQVKAVVIEMRAPGT
ncbi:MAG: NACHT domain-containing protein [Acidithiobacillus sp.]